MAEDTGGTASVQSTRCHEARRPASVQATRCHEACATGRASAGSTLIAALRRAAPIRSNAGLIPSDAHLRSPDGAGRKRRGAEARGRSYTRGSELLIVQICTRQALLRQRLVRRGECERGDSERAENGGPC